MRKSYKLTLFSIIIFSIISLYYGIYDSKTTDNEKYFVHQLALKEKHKHLSYAEIKNLPKQDRPDLAALQHFEMTMDSKLGYPPIERKIVAYEKLLAKKKR